MTEEFEGKLENFGKGKTTTGKDVWKADIGGKKFSWWDMDKALEAFNKIDIGSDVVVLFEEKANPNNESNPYRNINEMCGVNEAKPHHTEEEIQTDDVDKHYKNLDEPKVPKEPYNPMFAGMIFNNTVKWLLEKNLPFDKFDGVFNKLWDKSIKLKKEKGG